MSPRPDARADELHAALGGGRAGHAAARGARPHRARRRWARSSWSATGPRCSTICSGGFLLDAAVQPAAAVRAGEDGRRHHPRRRRQPHRPGQRPPGARPRSCPTSETGHPAPHRRARRPPLDVPVISVSEDMGVITVYVGSSKHVLQEIPRLLDRANQALQTLGALQEPPRRGARPACRRSRSRTSSPCATWPPCCSAARWCAASPRRSRR